MTLRGIVILSAAVLLIAYRLYGGLLARWLRLDPSAKTPAVDLRDDVDYVPIDRGFLLSQHFSAIAAAGPIVGPILAGVMFGWLPALLWILLGSIFIGGVHDIAALVASIRHKARSIGEVVREHISGRSYAFFLLFVWFALAYIIVAFTDITAASFVGIIELENDQSVSGGGIATSSALYLALPVIMGLLIRFTKLPVGVATLIFLPLVALSIWLGQVIPLDIGPVVGWVAALIDPQAAGGEVSPATIHTVWNMILLVYCLVASLAPMWLLLQPRGHLGGYFLYASLGGGMLGLLIGGDAAAYPAFVGWESARGEPLFPILFITIACGACSGFHAIVASGTTSKQLRTEPDAKPVAYGAMLLEAMVAVISLACVMRLAKDSPLIAGGGRPNFLYAQGVGSFLQAFGIPAAFAVSFALMAFTTFVYDTLDVCTRLGRYIVQELTGWRGRAGKAFAAIVTVGVPAFFLLYHGVAARQAEVAAEAARTVAAANAPTADTAVAHETTGAAAAAFEAEGWHGLVEQGRGGGTSGSTGHGLPAADRATRSTGGAAGTAGAAVVTAPVPAWKLFWELFGASNQLLAALTLIGLTVWLWRTRRALWVIPVLGLPTAWMYVMSTWALVRVVAVEIHRHGLGPNPVPWVGMLLIALAILLIAESAIAFARPSSRPFPRFA